MVCESGGSRVVSLSLMLYLLTWQERVNSGGGEPLNVMMGSEGMIEPLMNEDLRVDSILWLFSVCVRACVGVCEQPRIRNNAQETRKLSAAQMQSSFILGPFCSFSSTCPKVAASSMAPPGALLRSQSFAACLHSGRQPLNRQHN